jgi:hypothetical protein
MIPEWLQIASLASLALAGLCAPVIAVDEVSHPQHTSWQNGSHSLFRLLGWQSIPPEKIFAVWIADYLFAFVLGVAFQYFTIRPMRNLSPGRGLVEALKADTLSLHRLAVGMYGIGSRSIQWRSGS